ncbi:MAG: prepilin peptidase [Patescibacteria group bacterium]|nr:prepilin peptidase [Patescibacteria group bacterium]
MFVYYLFFVFIFGAIIGSFLNVVILRLRNKKTFLKGRSYCPKCKKKIVWYDNLPVLSFIILKGRCRYCKKKISLQYPIIELITGLLFAIAFLVNLNHSILETDSNFQFLILLFRDWLFISILIIIFVYDFRWYLILDKITFPAMGAALVINILLGFSLVNILIGAIIGGSFFLIQFLLSQGKWVGGGDIRMGVLMGIMLGWKMLLAALFLAYIIGFIISIILLLFKKKKIKSQIPLGTFLSVATVIILLYGKEIWEWYFNIIF